MVVFFDYHYANFAGDYQAVTGYSSFSLSIRTKFHRKIEFSATSL